MKKALIVNLSMAFVVAISASSWAQEVQPSLNDTAVSPTIVQGAVAADPIPATQLPMVASNCGCAQTFTSAPFQQYVQPAVAYQPTGCSSCNSCAGCGTIGQVAYNEIIPTGSPMASAPIVTSAPIAAYRQAPTYSNASGCCGPTYAPNVSYSNASVATPVASAPTWTGNPCNPCNTCNTCPDPCDPCAQQQRRGLFSRFRR